jgi:hypothetical protein
VSEWEGGWMIVGEMSKRETWRVSETEGGWVTEWASE